MRRKGKIMKNQKANQERKLEENGAADENEKRRGSG